MKEFLYTTPAQKWTGKLLDTYSGPLDPPSSNYTRFIAKAIEGELVLYDSYFLKLLYKLFGGDIDISEKPNSRLSAMVYAYLHLGGTSLEIDKDTSVATIVAPDGNYILKLTTPLENLWGEVLAEEAGWIDDVFYLTTDGYYYTTKQEKYYSLKNGVSPVLSRLRGKIK